MPAHPQQIALISDAEALTPESRFAVAKAMAKGLAAKLAPEVRLESARAFCFQMLKAHWEARCRAARCKWSAAKGPVTSGPQDPGAAHLAQEIGEIAAAFEPGEASYLLGTVYTTMLPADLRSEWGAFYTPPPFVSRLMDLAGAAGFDWARGSAIDPACGGGAFLTPVALRMLEASPGGSAEFRLARITSRLRGAELDPFAAWMSHVLLESALLPLCAEAKKRLPNLIKVGDSLDLSEKDKYDLVIGNPPYGRVTLDEKRRERYSRSLFGHANLYGLFTDLAIRLAKPSGIVAYVTPTSFLGGQYFKALRELLAREAPPQFVDFIARREGVFDDVLQETLLAVYHKGAAIREASVCEIAPLGPRQAQVEPAGRAPIEQGGGPWLLPRDARQARFFEKLGKLGARLGDYGFEVSTGPLVWNRHKGQLREENKGQGVFPLIWAESVSANRFKFQALRRNHAPYFQIEGHQDHLLAKEPCALVQRTTAKEQNRRLVAAVMPASFLKTHRAAVIENHLNVIRRTADNGVSLAALAAVLNSEAADAAFRCISGSVAVSAYELEALPLPGPKDMKSIEALVSKGAEAALIEKTLNKIYGLTP